MSDESKPKSERFLAPLVGSELVKELIDRDLLPMGTTRCIIDSGQPGEPMRVYWAGFADVDLLRAILDKAQEWPR
jgi:hypothetical protein